MIAIDTNAWRHFLGGVIDSRSALIAKALNINEALSHGGQRPHQFRMTLRVPLLPLRNGYWFRAGRLRRELLSVERSAPIADCLIAQACIDSNVPLNTYDDGFTRCVYAGLELL